MRLFLFIYRKYFSCLFFIFIFFAIAYLVWQTISWFLNLERKMLPFASTFYRYCLIFKMFCQARSKPIFFSEIEQISNLLTARVNISTNPFA